MSNIYGAAFFRKFLLAVNNFAKKSYAKICLNTLDIRLFVCLFIEIQTVSDSNLLLSDFILIQFQFHHKTFCKFHCLRCSFVWNKSTNTVVLTISGQCSHFIPPEILYQRFSGLFRGYKIGTLAWVTWSCFYTFLNFLTPKLLSHGNQSIDLFCKSNDWFLYDGNFGV